MKYQPELGQMAFSSWHETPVPDYIDYILHSLRSVARIVLKEDSGDFAWDGTCFKAVPYDWSDDGQEHNFIWKDVKIRWYKHCGRGMSMNRFMNEAEARMMFIECLKELAEHAE